MDFTCINIMYKINLMCDNKYLRKQSEHIVIVYRMYNFSMNNLEERWVSGLNHRFAKPLNFVLSS